MIYKTAPTICVCERFVFNLLYVQQAVLLPAVIHDNNIHCFRTLFMRAFCILNEADINLRVC